MEDNKEQELKNIEQVNPNDIWFSLPTVSGEFPPTVAMDKETEFDIHIHEDDYRQNEFLNSASLPQIEEELIGIKDIWENYSKKTEKYTLFKNCYARRITGEPNLKINFNALKSLLKCNSVGQVIINRATLANGFAVKTADTTYYGTLNANNVTQLCINQWDENTVNEIVEINKAFNLVFVSWCSCNIIKND